MIFGAPSPDEPIDQGDIIDDCPAVRVKSFDPQEIVAQKSVEWDLVRAYVLTQTCDLAQQKAASVVIATVLDASKLIADGELKAAEVRGPIRAGRVFGWCFLPRSSSLNLPESIVDLRRIFTVPLSVLEALRQAGPRRARLQPLYREHLAQHFANTYSRIGLPMPYETD